jgi:DNA mismatch repair protein MutS
MTQPDSLEFDSILFVRQEDGDDVDALDQPPSFPDLNLDQLLRALVAGREDYRLEPFFYAPLPDVGAVRYRQDVFRDLEREPVAAAIRDFARRMAVVRTRRSQAERLRYRYERRRWFLDSAREYAAAVDALSLELRGLELRSRGLLSLRTFLTAYTAGAAFGALAAETDEMHARLRAVRYAVEIRGRRVRVLRDEGEDDYRADVEETFARFQQDAGQDYRVALRDWPELNHVEAQILELVARLHPDVFAALDEYCERNRDYLDRKVARFDREVQFYVAYLEQVERLRAGGLVCSYPRFAEGSETTWARGAFDVALARELGQRGGLVVRNDFELQPPEQVIVVTGPNQGGKTTFARMFGQLHHLAALGCPVPAESAVLPLADRVLAHFEREEDILTLRGKLEDELTRLHELLEAATAASVLVVNESFSSTTLADGRLLGREILELIVERGARCVYVTFVDELASLNERTVSMVGTVDPDDPARRTFRIVRKPADGLAYASAIAEKYGLSYDSLRRRIPA